MPTVCSRVLRTTWPPTLLALVLTMLAPARSANAQAGGACDGQWIPLGGGTNSFVYSLVSQSDGGVIVGGLFTTADGIPLTSHIARWSGSAWSAMGSGINGTVYALSILPGGDVIAGGSFSIAGGVAAINIARWNGSEWSPLGTGVNDTVYALAALPSGEIIAGGAFSTAGAATARYIARWDGSQWVALGPGLALTARTIARLPSGDVVAGGDFSSIGNGGIMANHIARWDGTAWTPMGAGLNNPVYALTVPADGGLVAAGGFTASGPTPLNRIARWNGSTWSDLGGGTNSSVLSLASLLDGGVAASGAFTSAGGVAANHVARWNGVFWAPFDEGMTNLVNTLATRPNGDIVAGGNFVFANGLSAKRIAAWPWNSPVVPPSIATQPMPGSGCIGAIVQFAVASAGTAPFLYRWQVELAPLGSNDWADLFDGPLFSSSAIVSGATLSTLTILNIQSVVADRYRCRVVNACGTAYSDPVLLSVLVPGFTLQPSSMTTCVSRTVSFSATAVAGDGSPAAYRWQIEAAPAGSESWADLADGTVNGSAAIAFGSATPSLTINNAQSSAAARYRCRVSGGCGVVYSTPATLFVLLFAPADFNGSGAVTIQDLFDFLTAWFAHLPTADFNRSGDVTVQDIFDFLSAWFAKC